MKRRQAIRHKITPYRNEINHDELYCNVIVNNRKCSTPGLFECMFCKSCVCLQHANILSTDYAVCQYCISNNNNYKNIANGIIKTEKNKQSKIKQIFVNCLVTIFDYKNKANYQQLNM